MATNFKTPGVYIKENGAVPPSVVGVETAFPAFIGYTEKALDGTRSLDLVPTRVTSLGEFEARFGTAFLQPYHLLPAGSGAPEDGEEVGLVALAGGGPQYRLMREKVGGFALHPSLELFYANGGGDCLIVSCGAYLDADGRPSGISKQALAAGLQAVAGEVGPTMLVVPDAARLGDKADFDGIAVAMLDQCLATQDRVAILDVWGTCNIPASATIDAVIADFRAGLGGAAPASLRYGIAYFPDLATSLVSAGDVDISRLAGGGRLAGLGAALTQAAEQLYPGASPGERSARAAAIVDDLIDPIGAAPPEAGGQSELTRALVEAVPGVANAFRQIAARESILPPSGAMAGVFARTDSTRGVWKAPANVGIAGLIAPTVEIDASQQEGLNAPLDGKAVNAIRTFRGRGALVWGARTLDGNSNDWRYVPVRRTALYVEQSIRHALAPFAFAPNTARTWVTVVTAIENFLTGLWRQGGLMGSTPRDAFFVACGLGRTMTADDILNGRLNVEVGLAALRPAEFVVLRFAQQMGPDP